MAAVRPHVNSARARGPRWADTVLGRHADSPRSRGFTTAKLPIAQFERKGCRRDDPLAPDFRTAIGSKGAQRRASRHTFGKDLSHVGVA
jgi:hypothetical protein